MNCLLVSTLDYNPGDEIIRLGVEHLVRMYIPDVKFRVIHKHDCRTLFAGFRQRAKTPRRLVSPVLYRFYSLSVGRKRENFLDSSDVVIFAGTPFIWRAPLKVLPFTSANAEWVDAIWKRLFNDLKDKQVFNLAAGTSITNNEDLNYIYEDKDVVRFLNQAVERCAATTARDSITKDILAQLGHEVPLLPCASIFAADGAEILPEKGEYVVLNVMPNAAHTWRGQVGDREKWRKTITKIVGIIRKDRPVKFVSHSEAEHRTAAEWFPDLPRYFSRSPLDLLHAYSRAIYGVCNRVHAGAAIASFEKPAVVIGGDSRIDLIRHFGLPAFDHREVDEDKIFEIIRDMEANGSSYSETLRARKSKAERDYLSILQRASGAGVPDARVVNV